MGQADIDAAIQAYYSRQFDEANRLVARSAQGELEFIRTQELIAERIDRQSRILVIGGATGVHAAALADQGHAVVLVDPVESHVYQARDHGDFEAQVGDARNLLFSDDSFDVALLLGPLYHLSSALERRRCLQEAARVVASGGWVFAAAIPRFMRHASVSLGQDVPVPYPSEWVELLESGTPPPADRFPAGHFHTAEELSAELADAGLLDVEVHAIEGVAGLPLEQLTERDPDLLAAALSLVRRTGGLTGIKDMSNHIMGIARVP